MQLESTTMRSQANDGVEFSTILSLLRHQAAAFPDKTAIEGVGTAPVSYQALCHRVENLARAIRDRDVEGAGRRPRIGIALSNGPVTSIVLLAASCAGIALPFNPSYREPEFETYFRQCRVDLVIVPSNHDSPAIVVAHRLGIPILAIDDSGELAGASESHSTRLEIALDPDDVALILLTSGSTGRAKSVPLTHRNVCVSARDVCRSIDLGPDDRCLSMWEQYHVGGLVDLMLAPLVSGGTIIATAGFNAANFYQLLHEANPTWFQGVPATLNELVQYADRHAVCAQPNPLRLVRSVAAALSPRLMMDLEALFDVPVIQTFGMTEAGPLISSTRLPPAERKPGSVGTSCGAEIGIFGANGLTRIAGETGELAVRGQNVFTGYENDPDANAGAFREGWFLTGDTGYFDEDGHLFLSGRIKQLINRGGEKVNPQEVEDALLAHAAVAEAAVFALKHPTLGEDVAAAVALRPGAHADSNEIRAFLATRLAPFKVPQAIQVTDRLPRNPVGKIDKLALVEAAQAPREPEGAPGEMTSLEARLAKIWARELNLDQVAPDSGFFQLGGDSLAAVRLMTAIEAEFSDRKLQLNAITTIREMALKIDAADGLEPTPKGEGIGLSKPDIRAITAAMELGTIPTASPGSAMKVVNPEGTRRPFFWCCNSPEKEMREFAAYSDKDRPVYGMFSGGRLLPNSDEMHESTARFYADRIQSIDPDGPYLIGGDCKGAWVAQRISRILIDAGKRVDALCLLEHADASLFDFEGRLLFIFGKQSRRRAYLSIGWGQPGWRSQFSQPPIVKMLNGRHGSMFRSDNAQGIISTIGRFLRDEAPQSDTSADFSSTVIRTVHRLQLIFGAYRAWHRLRERLRYGRRVKLNPFTGDPFA